MARKMKRRKFLGILGGLGGLAALGGGAAFYFGDWSSMVLPPTRISNASDNHQVILDHERDFVDYYLDSLKTVKWIGLGDSMEKHGKGKMQDIYFKLYLDALNHAEGKIDGTASDRDDSHVFRRVAKEFTSAMKKHDLQQAINYLNGPVVKAYVDWTRINSEFYGDLLAQEHSSDFGVLLRRAYPAKGDFERFLTAQDGGIDLIYDAFFKSRQGWRGAIAGGTLESARTLTKKFYRDARVRDYGE